MLHIQLPVLQIAIYPVLLESGLQDTFHCRSCSFLLLDLVATLGGYKSTNLNEKTRKKQIYSPNGGGGCVSFLSTRDFGGKRQNFEISSRRFERGRTKEQSIRFDVRCDKIGGVSLMSK